MKDKNTIINDMVMAVADIMEAKAHENDCIIELLLETGVVDKFNRLREKNARIMEAIDLIRENEGCWA